MALDNAQKVSIRYWLGYSGRFYQTDSALEQGMAAISDADLEARIAAVLSDLTDVDGRRGLIRAQIGVKQVDEIVFQDGASSALSALQGEGTMLVGRLAALLGVEVRHNPFSASAGSPNSYMRQG